MELGFKTKDQNDVGDTAVCQETEPKRLMKGS